MSKTTEPPKILICPLSTYERHGWLTRELGEFLYSLRFIIGYATAVAFAHNFAPAAAARNFFCKQFRDSEAEWLCMIDNDMAVPPNVLDTIKDAPEDAGIVVPVFYLWDQSKGSCVLCWGFDAKPEKAAGAQYFHMTPGFHELTKCGTGVIFIRRTALEKLQYPYFTYLYNDDGGLEGTEDIQFCKRAREAGIKIYGNTSIHVGHYHTVNLLTMAHLLYDEKEEVKQ